VYRRQLLTNILLAQFDIIKFFSNDQNVLENRINIRNNSVYSNKIFIIKQIFNLQFFLIYLNLKYIFLSKYIYSYSIIQVFQEKNIKTK
jgi:hypothetical protein